MNTSNGILYLNSGDRLLPKLFVSLYSLRKVYQKDITIILLGQQSNKIYDIIKHFDCSAVHVDRTLQNNKHYWFEKSRINLYSPYKNSIFIDSDTVIQHNFDELFTEITNFDFIVPQFAQWRTAGKKMKKRLRQWEDTDKDLVDLCIRLDTPAINVGVYGFNKDSEFMQNWFDLTIKNINAKLPEETTCHLLLNKYKSKIIDSIYNYSCKYDESPINLAKIIHYHGRKHCRFDNNYKPKYNSDIWIKNWIEILDQNIINIKNWYNNYHDTYLKNLMSNLDKIKL
jgi:hypothetical protein